MVNGHVNLTQYFAYVNYGLFLRSLQYIGTKCDKKKLTSVLYSAHDGDSNKLASRSVIVAGNKLCHSLV